MREFIDEDHPIASEYYTIMDAFTKKNGNGIISRLKNLISEDPDFFDTYNSLQDLLISIGKNDKANDLIREAYERAVRRIINKQGNWPDRLEWEYIENRHIIRAIFNQSLSFWKNNLLDQGLKIFRKLLHSNPNDNLGVRYFILAIKQKMKFSEFNKRFAKKGYYTIKIDEWFNDNYLLFPDEFEGWRKEIENEEEGEVDEVFDEEDFYGDSGIKFI